VKNFWQWLVRPVTTVQQDEIRELTEQFYVTLAANFARLPANDDRPSARRVKDLLEPNAERSWTHAYEIEQLLVNLYDDETVRTELEIRVVEAKPVLRAEQSALYEQELKAARDLDTPAAAIRRRVVLGRLVNDLQWRYTVNEAVRRYSKTVTSRAGTLFVAAIGVFAALVAYTVLRSILFSHMDLRLFGFAASAGAWGATFSVLSSLKNRLMGTSLDDLKLMRPWVMLVSRALIGAGAASILYFFILSGLLGNSAISNIFPNFTPDSPTLPLNQLALLVVWSFIAGFSERLVPGLLERTESRVESGAAKTSDRFRPTPDGGGETAIQSRRNGGAAPPAEVPAAQPPSSDRGGASPPATG